MAHRNVAPINATHEFIEEHKRIMDLRHDYVAHAGNQFDKCHVIGTLYPPFIDINSQLRQVVNMPLKLNDFKLLCEWLVSTIEIRIKHNLTAIHHYASNLNIDELNRLIIKVCHDNIYASVERKSEDGTSYWVYEKQNPA